MSIAQHFVAGEGETRPEPADQADVAALAEFSCDTTNLPWIIFRAAHRAAHVSGVPGRARALLSALARTVDAQRPFAAIFARRELLTGRAMQSMRTFYRSLDDLEAAGLIVRPPQKRYGEAGLFGRAYLHLTQLAAELLGLIEPPVIDVNQAPAPEHPQAGNATAPSLPAPSASVADGAIYKDLSPEAFQKRQPGQLPADLQRLRSLGFHEFLIFKLMKEAKQQGKLLSDVVAVVWQHLKAANRPINYLRKLLSTPTDFAHQRRARQAAIDATREAERVAHEVQAVLSRCVGQTFFDAGGTRKIVISADVSTTHDVREPQPRVMAGSWQAGFIDALRAGRLLPATAEFEEQFAARRREHLRAHAPATVRHDTPPAARSLTRVGGDQLGILARLVGARRATASGSASLASPARS
ncbi:Replication protein O [Paraburkholderia caledonica]